MALTGYQIVRGIDLDELERKVIALAADNYVPYGPVSYNSEVRQFWQTMIIGDVAGGYIPPTPDPEPEP